MEVKAYCVGSVCRRFEAHHSKLVKREEEREALRSKGQPSAQPRPLQVTNERETRPKLDLYLMEGVNGKLIVGIGFDLCLQFP